MSTQTARPGSERAQETGQLPSGPDPPRPTSDAGGGSGGEQRGGAGERAHAVADEARQQADSALHELRDRATEQAGYQTEQAARALRQWSGDLADLAEHATHDSPAKSLTAQLADGSQRAAEYLERNGLDGVWGELRCLARRRPAAFLGGAALAGLVVGRAARARGGSTPSDGSSDGSEPGGGPASGAGAAPGTGAASGAGAGGGSRTGGASGETAQRNAEV
ncbi:hypothetical protein E0L36_01375 [Streptomyces sp. AJS327]|uniref:hypothetical protein n=1 Tax=Streptomyces sp. AJS327 TaxID=2545265 RepID=UPI0015DD585D|nr:hypothetical protein [Streptomyces sp. AJS327]MBA0049605.1 hypothetical protein [Streptomyces sp. AJS327]